MFPHGNSKRKMNTLSINNFNCVGSRARSTQGKSQRAVLIIELELRVGRSVIQRVFVCKQRIAPRPLLPA